MKKNKILLIGGFGFIGYHLSSYLLEVGQGVIILGHRSMRTKELFDVLERKYKNKLEFIEDDIDPDVLHDLVHQEKDIIAVFHLAAIKTTTGTTDFPSDIISQNGMVDESVFNFCQSVLDHRDENDKRRCKLIYVSTGEVYGGAFDRDFSLNEKSRCIIDSDNAYHLYPLSKIAGEMVLKHGAWEFEWNIVRLQNPYGPYMPENMLPAKIVRTAIRANIEGGATLKIEKGNDTRPYVYISDVVQGLSRVCLHGKNKETYNLAGESVAVFNVALDFKKHSPNMVVTGNVLIKGEHRKMDCSKIKDIWVPTVSIEEGLKKMYDVYMKEGLIAQSMKNLGL